MVISLSASGVSASTDGRAHIENKTALDGGLYFHARHIAHETDDGICFPKKKGGGVWFPKAKVHVLKCGNGRVDVWVEPNLVRQTDKEYEEILGPDVAPSSLPSPIEELGEPTVLTEDFTAKTSGIKFVSSREIHETDDGIGLPTSRPDNEYVWIPKSQCHAIEKQHNVVVWVRTWLVDKKPGLNYLK